MIDMFDILVLSQKEIKKTFTKSVPMHGGSKQVRFWEFSCTYLTEHGDTPLNTIVFYCSLPHRKHYSQLSLRRTPLGPALSVRLREVSVL